MDKDNNILKKPQGNTSMALAREKRPLSPCSGSEEEIPTPPKRMKILSPSCMSPVQKTLSSTDLITSPSSCEKRADESSESPQSQRFRGRRRKLSGFSGKSKDLLSILQTNFTMLKERMESTELSEKLFSKGFLDAEDFENILKGKSRNKKNEILLKALCKPRYRENIEISTFLSALNESGQSQLVNELSHRPICTQILPEISTNEMRDLLSFASRMKDKLLEEVEPRRFIDDIVSAGGITIEDHETISTIRERRQRVQFLLNRIGSARHTIAVRILKPMADMYSDLFQAFKGGKTGNCSQTEKAERQEEISAPVGSHLTLKYKLIPLTTICVQDKNEHDHPATKMQQAKQEAAEIEKAIVAGSDETQLEQLFENCMTEFQKIKFSCIKIYMKVLSKGSLEKLATYSRSGAAKRLFLSLLDEETKQKLLALNAKVKIEVYKGCECSVGAVPCAVECLCTLDKENITRNFTSLMKDMRGSRRIINRIMKMQLLDNKAKKSMEEIKIVRQIEDRNERLLKFLLQNDLPKVCFCVLEEEIIRHGGNELLRQILKDDKSTFDSKSLMVLTKHDIRNNKDLLRKELEARWFIRRLENKKNPLTQALVGNILASSSREERVDALLEYLVKEKDKSWFVEELRVKNEHLLNTLMRGKDSENVSADFSRCKIATRHFFDDIIEEIDPLIFSKWISVEAKKELHFSELESLRERKKRAVKFSLQLLRTSQSIFYEALHAMTTCGYENLVENIATLAKEGPLNSRYKCAKIQHIEGCEISCVVADEFTLEEHYLHLDQSTSAKKFIDTDHDPVNSVGSESEDDCFILNAEVCNPTKDKEDNPGFTEILDTSPIRLKLSRRSRVQSIKGGSESGVFSGSGVNTEDINTDEDSDYEDRSSEVDKRSLTKKWIECHSKSDSFYIAGSTVNTTVAQTEERKNNLLGEKHFIKHGKGGFTVPLEKFQPNTALIAPLQNDRLETAQTDFHI